MGVSSIWFSLKDIVHSDNHTQSYDQDAIYLHLPNNLKTVAHQFYKNHGYGLMLYYYIQYVLKNYQDMSCLKCSTCHP